MKRCVPILILYVNRVVLVNKVLQNLGHLVPDRVVYESVASVVLHVNFYLVSGCQLV